jgi:putative nucleotidyltransferase with HDIG domain
MKYAHHHSTIKQWLRDYTHAFIADNPSYTYGLSLKYRHCIQVAEEMRLLATALGLVPEQVALAQIMGLLHDVGRFEQLVRYGTFADFKSENHAVLGLRIINETGVVNDIDDAAIQYIHTAIANHNKAALPEGLDDVTLRYCRMLRDADKLDIYSVMLDYYLNPERNKDDGVEYRLPESHTVSPAITDDLLAGRIADVRNLVNANDFKLFQMGWVFDVNYDITCQEIVRRNYLSRLRAYLPALPVIDEVYTKINQYIYHRCSAQRGVHG